MISHINTNDSDYFHKRIKEKEHNRMKEYKEGKIDKNFTGARKHARLVRNSKAPKPL